MSIQKEFFYCEHCGNIVSMIKNSGAKLTCCGQAMKKMEPNTTDAATEKHVPVIARDGCKINVAVGSVFHPMTPEHHIAWIVVSEENRVQRAIIEKSDSPSAQFCVGEGAVCVYAYCNLHGLWMAEI